MHRKLVMSAAVAMIAVPALAGGINPTLRKEPHINESLLAVAVGDQIRRNCSTISPRPMTVYRKAKALEAYAISKGFTSEEIKTYVNDRAEKDRVKAQARKYLTASGVKPGNEATYCKLGREEIANGSLTGEMLKTH
jgi:hypothetical protein